MSIKIALAGNPNCGKTTLFNALTGSNQFVGNWPGVTVEKKEGRLKGYQDVIIVDLPGIYSLSPYTQEEVVARNYLLMERPDVIINIVDGTNIERNLYLSTQILELGIPVLIAVNMMDVLAKKGDRIYIDKLGERMGCEVVEISALKETGILEAAQKAIGLAEQTWKRIPMPIFSEGLEKAVLEVEQMLEEDVLEEQKRFYAIKLLERDAKIAELLKQIPEVSKQIRQLEEQFDDDTESIVTNERYVYVSAILKDCSFKNPKDKLSSSERIDRIVTNRWLALPIFALVMFLVYYISITTVGAWATEWANDGVFGDGWHLFGIDSVFIPGIPVLAEWGLNAIGCANWLQELILNGIISGVGAVLGFVPQLLVLFCFLSFLEACGYMARVAFIMDRIFRKFGLSGKSFIPMLIGSGCSVPGIMASRTIENERDRKMTIITTSFIPCGAKLPLIALIAGALFDGAWWVATSAYFIGILAVLCSGLILKKTRFFVSEESPFVLELPDYHMPTIRNLLRNVWERGWSFIKKAGTVILISTIILWFLMRFGWVDGNFGMLKDSQMNHSILALIGGILAPVFTPLGWGDWKMTVAALTGLIAKENIVGTFGVLLTAAKTAEKGKEIWVALANSISAPGAYSFLVFNLLCAPCFAAMAAIRREMNQRRWFWFAIGYQTILAYVVSFCLFQLSMLFRGERFGIGAAMAILLLIIFFYFLLRPDRTGKK